jgi:hypothetical protein
MARTTLTKHVARRQEQTFADWCVEVRDLAGERPSPNALCGLGRRRDAATSPLHGWAHSAAENRSRLTYRDGQAPQGSTASNHFGQGSVQHG